jgi:hypothetical protein
MATIEKPTATTGDDTAIAELQEMVGRQRAAFLADPFPSLEERRGLLGALAGMLMSHRTQIQEALSSDFGVHPLVAADLIEVLGPAGRAGYAAEQLGSWMAPEPRQADPALYGSGHASQARLSALHETLAHADLPQPPSRSSPARYGVIHSLKGPMNSRALSRINSAARWTLPAVVPR